MRRMFIALVVCAAWAQAQGNGTDLASVAFLVGKLTGKGSVAADDGSSGK